MVTAIPANQEQWEDNYRSDIEVTLQRKNIEPTPGLIDDFMEVINRAYEDGLDDGHKEGYERAEKEADNGNNI